MYNLRVPGEQQLNEGLGEVKRGEEPTLRPTASITLYLICWTEGPSRDSIVMIAFQLKKEDRFCHILTKQLLPSPMGIKDGFWKAHRIIGERHTEEKGGRSTYTHLRITRFYKERLQWRKLINLFRILSLCLRHFIGLISSECALKRLR